MLSQHPHTHHQTRPATASALQQNRPVPPAHFSCNICAKILSGTCFRTICDCIFCEVSSILSFVASLRNPSPNTPPHTPPPPQLKHKHKYRTAPGNILNQMRGAQSATRRLESRTFSSLWLELLCLIPRSRSLKDCSRPQTTIVAAAAAAAATGPQQPLRFPTLA